MIHSIMALWHGLSRKSSFSVNNPVLLVIAFLAFLFISWQTLHLFTTPDNTGQEGGISIPGAKSGLSTSSPTCTTPTSSYDAKKVAFLAETRPLPHLPALFAHMTAVVPPEWKFKFMGSSSAIEFMRSNIIIKRLEASSKLDILSLPSNYSMSSRETISQMFTDLHLYQDILAPAEHLLVFQPDSILCANAPKTVNDYLEWDWIGAPWSPTATFGGNGGLSLRKVSKILKVLKTQHRKPGDGQLEDLWISDRLRKIPDARMPNATVSKTFSVESVWDEAPLGYHIGWLGVHHEQIWDEEQQVKHVLEYCPEVKIILGMKLDNDKPTAVEEIDSEKVEGREKEDIDALTRVDSLSKSKSNGQENSKPKGGKAPVNPDSHLVSEPIKLRGGGSI